MYYYYCLYILFLIFFAECSDSEKYDNLMKESDEFLGDEYVMSKYLQNLTEKVFDKYDAEVSPFSIGEDYQYPELVDLLYDENYTADSSLFIKKWKYSIGVQQLNLIDVDEPKEQMTVIMEIVQSWHDARLEWDIEEYGNISQITTRLDKIWSLPFIAYGASEVVEHRDQNYRTAQIYNQGQVMVHIPLRMTTKCKMLMNDFPFDTQICAIRLGLPLHSSHTFTIKMILPNHLLNSCTLGNSAWDIINVTYGQEMILSDDTMFDHDKLAVIKLHLKRNPMFYMYMIVLPTFIINSISIAGVFLKNAEKMDKLTVGLTHIMTMTFILTLIADRLPKTEKIPLLGKYIIFGLCTMIVAMTFSTYLKKISRFFDVHLEHTRSSFGQKLRRFIGTPLRVICLIIFQAVNLLAGLYLLYRLMCFEYKYTTRKCYEATPTMDIIPEIFANGSYKEL